MPKCTPADIQFLDQAQVKEVNTVVLPAPADEVFALFKDAEAWPKWFGGMNKVVWTSPEPYGVGTTRSVWLGPLRVDEYFFDWVENERFAFYFTGTNLPFVRSLVEVYELQPLSDQRCSFTYTVAYNPAFPLSVTGPVGRALLARSFKQAAHSLAKFLSR